MGVSGVWFTTAEDQQQLLLLYYESRKIGNNVTGDTKNSSKRSLSQSSAYPPSSKLSNHLKQDMILMKSIENANAVARRGRL
ncbi:MAG TPA: hypothetical protein DHV65_02480 [Ktedonobacter sp.]|nr:hypothetical protein [Ktedonobacter sp.]